MENKKNLHTSGLFLAWMVFLRPFLFPFFMLPIFYLATKKQSIHIKLKAILIFSASIFIIESAWVCRNYLTMNELIIIETPAYISYGKIYSKSWLEIRNLINVWGGDAAYFEPNSMSQWFRRDWDNRPIESVINESIFENSSYKKNDVLVLRKKYFSFINDNNSHANGEVDNKIANEAKKMKTEFITNNFYKSHLNRWLNLKSMILKTGTPYLNLNKNKKSYIPIKIYGLIYYYLFLITGLTFLLLSIIKKSEFAIICSISFFLFTLIFVYYSPITESRYFLFPHLILIFISFISFFKPKYEQNINSKTFQKN